jgi:hypothetical protein
MPGEGWACAGSPKQNVTAAQPASTKILWRHQHKRPDHPNTVAATDIIGNNFNLPRGTSKVFQL